MGLDLVEEGPDEREETQPDGQGLYLIGNIFNSPEEDATSKWMAKWGTKNEHLERQKPPGWWDGVWEMRHLLGEGHSLLDTGVGVGWNREIHCQRPRKMVHQVLGEGQKLPAGGREGMKPRQQRLQTGGPKDGKRSGLAPGMQERAPPGARATASQPRGQTGPLGRGRGYGGKKVRSQRRDLTPPSG